MPLHDELSFVDLKLAGLLSQLLRPLDQVETFVLAEFFGGGQAQQFDGDYGERLTRS